ARLSHSDRLLAPTPAFRETLRRGVELVPGLAPPTGHEPYRTQCRVIAGRLEATLAYLRGLELCWPPAGRAPPPAVYSRREELAGDLRAIASDLRHAGAESAAGGLIHDLVRQVEVFGLHLLTLDVREHSDRHARALEEVLAWAGVCP